jgi:hypothetical protein
LLERFKAAQGSSNGIKDFIEVLMLNRDFAPEAVEQAVEAALSCGVSSAEAVRHLLMPPAAERVPDKLQAWPSLPEADISVYTQLGGVV